MKTGGLPVSQAALVCQVINGRPSSGRQELVCRTSGGNQQIRGCGSSEVADRQRSWIIKGCGSSEVAAHQRLRVIKGREKLPDWSPEDHAWPAWLPAGNTSS